MDRGVFRGALCDEQQKVFALIWNGKTSREISALLALSPSKVDQTVRKTCRQLHARDRQDAALIIARHYHWKPNDDQRVQVRAPKNPHWVGQETPPIATRMVANENAIKNSQVYLHHIGDERPILDQRSGRFGRNLGQFLRLNSKETPAYIRTILIIGLLLVCSAFALSGLISAMQGFNVLITS